MYLPKQFVSLLDKLQVGEIPVKPQSSVQKEARGQIRTFPVFFLEVPPYLLVVSDPVALPPAESFALTLVLSFYAFLFVVFLCTFTCESQFATSVGKRAKTTLLQLVVSCYLGIVFLKTIYEWWSQN